MRHPIVITSHGELMNSNSYTFNVRLTGFNKLYSQMRVKMIAEIRAAEDKQIFDILDRIANNSE